MKGILTPEEKKYLRMVSNYIQSMGMNEAIVDFVIEDSYFDLDNITWDHITHFENNYRAEIPEGYLNILKKVLNHLQETKGFDLDIDQYLNYERIEVRLDAVDKEFSVSHSANYYTQGDTNTTEYTSEEDEDVKQVFKDLEELINNGELHPDEYDELTVTYNGSGDSGYIEGDFTDGGGSVPADVENLCYRILENSHGGWEINEGSDGKFVFEMKTGTLTLFHTYNIEQDYFDTLYEESFAK